MKGELILVYLNELKKYINNTEEVWIFKKSSILRQDENKNLHSLMYQEIQA